MGGGFDKKPGGSRTSPTTRALSEQTPGKRSLTERLPPRSAETTGSKPSIPRLQLGSGTGAVQPQTPPTTLPYRAEMERRFGTSFDGVVAHVGERDALEEIGANAGAHGNVVMFADANPAPDLVAHELTHVVQQRGGGPVTAASSTFAPAGNPAELEAESNAAIVRRDPGGHEPLRGVAPAVGALQLDSNDKQPTPDPPKAAGKSEGADAGISDWAGAGKAGTIFRNSTAQTDTNDTTHESVDIHTSWTLAEYEQAEIKTNMAMEVVRKIHIRLAHGAGVIVESKLHVWFDAEHMPNDVHAALEIPSELIKHDGVILVSDDKGLHTVRTLERPLAKAASPASMFAGDPMLAFDAQSDERLRAATKFVTATLPKTEENLTAIRHILDEAPHVAEGLKKHIAIRLNYETPPAELIQNARNHVARIDEMVSFTATGHEGLDLLMQLHSMSEHFTNLIHQAEIAKPEVKTIRQIQDDEVLAIGHAGAGIVQALKETGLMIYDLWPYGAFAAGFGNALDYWDPQSSVGKAFKSGKSGGEIFVAAVEGFVDNFSNAFDHASNGDYSKLMDVTAEFAVDVAIEVASGGAASPAVGARVAEHGLTLSEDALQALTRRTESALAKAKRVAAKAGEEVTTAMVDAMDALDGLLDAFRRARKSEELATAGGPRAYRIDPTAALKGMQRARSERALNAAKTAMGKLRGGTARAQGEAVIQELEKLAKSSKMVDAISGIARRISRGEDKAKFVSALDRFLRTTSRRLDEELVTAVVARVADAVDPIAFLEEIEWTMTHKGLSLEARTELLRQAVLRKGTPLDLGWLRDLTDLPDNMLEAMALDPNTNWKTFMKVSKNPSEFFPKSVKKLLKNKDYAQANAKLRGVAGELVFIVDDVALPDGLKIVGRQVDAAGKRIDFMLQDAAGKPALMEVKAWTAETWAEELAANARRKTPSGMFGHMVDQLRAAKSSGKRVYLAVSSAIGDDYETLIQRLGQFQLGDVTVVRFPEAKLTETARKLRGGLGLAAGVATVGAAEVSQAERENDDD